MSDQRMLLLDTYGEITELTGDFSNIMALLGRKFVVYEAVPGLCIAVSITSTACTYGEPNLHLSKYAHLTGGVIAPLFGSAVVFGGITETDDGFCLKPLDREQEMKLVRSVGLSKIWLTDHAEDARRGALLANNLRAKQRTQA